MRTPIIFDENFIQSPIVFEEWKPITEISVPNIADGYFVSNFGRFCSTLRKNPVLLTLQMTNCGYYRVNLRDKFGNQNYYLAHRIVMIEFHYIDNFSNMQVNHVYGDKSDNWDLHLEWVTGSENITHAFKTGLKSQNKGESCSFATITNDQANMIGKLLAENELSHKEIADIVQCPVHIVSNISTGTTWKHIYNKYKLYLRPKKNYVLNLSDDELNELCKYLENNSNNGNSKIDNFKIGIYKLFGIKYNSNMSASASRILNHKTRNNIVDKYNY